MELTFQHFIEIELTFQPIKLYMFSHTHTHVTHDFTHAQTHKYLNKK